MNKLPSVAASDWVRPAEAAKLARVNRTTIYRWMWSGLARSKKTNRIRVRLSDVLELAK